MNFPIDVWLCLCGVRSIRSLFVWKIVNNSNYVKLKIFDESSSHPIPILETYKWYCVVGATAAASSVVEFITEK